MTQNETLLNDFTITHVLPCMADPERKRVLADLTDDVSPVFPYLNATLRQAIFNPAANSLTLRQHGKLLTLYARKAVLAKVEDRLDGEQQLAELRDLCNQTWQQRLDIAPCYLQRQRVEPTEIYLLLPRKNCGECGLPTCWAFTWELIFGEGQLADCRPLAEPDWSEAVGRLQELLA